MPAVLRALVRRGARAALLVALAGAGAPAARAQTAQIGATIDGLAIGADDDAPIAFALVRLLGPASDSALQKGVTSAGGRYHFAGLPAGEYRVQLARIGFRPVLSPTLRVRAGEVVHHDLRGAAQAVELAAMTVPSGPTCFDAAHVADDPRVAAVWQQARAGVEQRRAFERQYRFTSTLTQRGTIRWRLRGDRPLHRQSTVVSEPDSAEARDQRRLADLHASGSATNDRLKLPNEKDLLDPDFLRDHCLEPIGEAADGAIALRFRATGRPNGVAIRGALWLDARTFLARRLDVEWLSGDDRIAEGFVAYDDVPVTGRALRLPTGGTVSARPWSVAQKALMKSATIDITYAYRDFAAVGGS